MPKKVYETLVDASVESVWEFHSTAEALNVLTPPSRKLRLVSHDLAVTEGAEHRFQVKVGPLWLTWVALLSEVNRPRFFCDTAVKSPFRKWSHRHEFLPHAKGTLIRDTVEYSLPMGRLGDWIAGGFVSRDIDALFAYRHRATRAHFGDSPK